MSRLTGTDAYSLMEAYQAVYAPQELTEEQAWEEVETWVNDLIEEGYDLSDYTWEEMYESYLEEGPYSVDSVKSAQQAAQARQVRKDAAAATLKTQRRSQDTADYTQAMRPVNSSAAKNAPAATPYVSRFAGSRDAAFAKAQNIKGSPVVGPKIVGPKIVGPKIVGPKIVGPGSPAAAPARTTPPARPAATAPAAPKPAMGPTGKPLVGGIERRTPTSAELKAAQAARAGGGALAQATAAASKPAAFSPTPAAATPTPAARPATPARPTPRQTRLNMEMEYDTFDTVLEYLVSEGYADTEESALVIMANMSEEWKQSIVTA